MDKNKQVKAEKERIAKLFVNLPQNKRQMVDALIDNCAFMTVTLKGFQEDIIKNGYYFEQTTGNGYGAMRSNPCVKEYTAMIARLSNVVDALMKYLPEEISKSKLTELIDE